MPPSVYWQGLQAMWVPRSGRFDQSMDRQRVFVHHGNRSPTEWRSVQSLRHQQEEAGEGIVAPVHSSSYSSFEFIVFA